MITPLYLLQNEFFIVIQRAPYIEDGPYIYVEDSQYTVWEIPPFGGDPWHEGDFCTLVEALERYNWILKNHT